MHVKIVKNSTDFITIKNQYKELYNESIYSDIFISYKWLLGTISNLISNTDEINIITVWDEKKLIAILPLCIRTKTFFACKYLTHLCFSYADYCLFLIKKNINSNSVFNILLNEVLLLAKKCDYIKIDNISSSNNILILFFIKLKRRIYKANLYTITENLRLDIKYFFEYKRYNSDYKDTLRRRNILKKKYNYKFNINNINDLIAWNKLVSFRKEKYGCKSMLGLKKTQDFFLLLKDNKTKTSTLEINNEIVAVHYGFVYKSKFYYYMPSFSKKMTKYGVGKILMLEIIEWCSDNNIQEFDMLRGLEDYKIPWSNKIYDNKTLFGFNNNKIKSNIIYYLFLIIKAIRTI